MVFGIAILAMCLDLMQEEIVIKFRWIGTKLGIYDEDDEQEQEDITKEKIEKQLSKNSKSDFENEKIRSAKRILLDPLDFQNEIDFKIKQNHIRMEYFQSSTKLNLTSDN